MSPRQKVTLKDVDLVPIQRQEITDGAQFAADVFLRMGADNYVLVARQGETANISQLHVVEHEDLEFLYVRREDYKNCVGQNLTIAGILLDKKDISGEKKAIFVSRAMEGVFKEIMHLGVSHESVEHARMVASNIRTLVEAKPDLLSVVKSISAVPGELLRHSIAVSSIAVMIAHKMGWTLQPTMEKLAMGGLLHDIGLKELPKEILTKARHELSLEERILYETHPFRGAEIMRSMPSLNADLIGMVYEHHENSVGQGYPRRLRDFRLNPLAKLVALADMFCELTFQTPNNPNPKLPEDALNYIETALGQPYNRQAFQALREILHRKAPLKIAS